MKKVIMTLEKPEHEVLGILFNSVDVHALEAEALDGVPAQFFVTQDYSRFEGHWSFDDDTAYETWYSEFGARRDELLVSLKEYLEVNEINLKTYSDITNTRIPDTLPIDQYVSLPKLIEVHR